MTVRHTVRVGQEWESNDARRPRFVRVLKILNYVTGQHVPESRIPGDPKRRAQNAHCMDRVQVEDLHTGRVTTIRRDQFMTGTRGWTLTKEAGNVAA